MNQYQLTLKNIKTGEVVVFYLLNEKEVCNYFIARQQLDASRENQIVNIVRVN